jgi:protein disulfide-isomerase-like protein
MQISNITIIILMYLVTQVVSQEFEETDEYTIMDDYEDEIDILDDYTGDGYTVGGDRSFDMHSEGVLKLDSDIYHKKVYDEKASIFIKFYAPWCGHCKSLAPIWSQLADEVSMDDNHIKVGVVDCTEQQLESLCTSFNVEGYPTLKFVDGQRRRIIDYQGERDISSMRAFAKGGYKKEAGSPFMEDMGFLDRVRDYGRKIMTNIVLPVSEFAPALLPGVFLLGFMTAMCLTCCWCCIGSPRLIIEFQTQTAPNKGKTE